MTAMAKMEKFLFDTEFEVDDEDWDKEEVVEAPDPDTLPHYSENEMRTALQEAREASHAEGLAIGLSQARSEIASFASQEMVKIGRQIERLADAEASNIDIARREAAGLALAVGRRLAGALIDRHPLAFAEQMIAETLSHLTETLRDSRIVIRVGPELVEPLSAHIAAITAKVAFTGQAIVIGEDGFAAGDCRVEWAHGGAERLMAEIDGWVGDALNRYLTAIEEPSAPEPDDLDEREEETAPEAVEQPEDGVKSVGGSKSVRYDAPASDADQPDADEIKTVGGSKSVRYD